MILRPTHEHHTCNPNASNVIATWRRRSLSGMLCNPMIINLAGIYKPYVCSPFVTLSDLSCIGSCRQPRLQKPSCAEPGSRDTSLFFDRRRASLEKGTCRHMLSGVQKFCKQKATCRVQHTWWANWAWLLKSKIHSGNDHCAHLRFEHQATLLPTLSRSYKIWHEDECSAHWLRCCALMLFCEAWLENNLINWQPFK